MAIKSIDTSDVAKITSGQVIIDLVSVVKELVENSIDAGSDKIEITFNNYGITSLEVSDNGCGIEPADFDSLCLKHHTSKLSSFEDLTSVSTLGFRGEAMSSLCSLANVKISTCTQSSFPKATELHFDHVGKLTSQKTVVSGKKGTTVTVTDLFHGMPVRQKNFVKNSKREYSKSLSILMAYLLAYTNVRFTVFNISGSTGKKSMAMGTQGAKTTTMDALVSIFGSNGAYGLVPIDIKSGNIDARFKLNMHSVPMELSIRVLGFISNSSFGLGRSSTDRQFLTVNKRPVTHKRFMKVINEVYKTFNTTQSPVFILDVELDTSFLDVNVTPDKRMVLMQSEDVLVEVLREELTAFFDNRNNVVPKSLLRVVSMGSEASSRLQKASSQARRESQVVEDNKDGEMKEVEGKFGEVDKEEYDAFEANTDNDQELNDEAILVHRDEEDDPNQILQTVERSDIETKQCETTNSIHGSAAIPTSQLPKTTSEIVDSHVGIHSHDAIDLPKPSDAERQRSDLQRTSDITGRVQNKNLQTRTSLVFLQEQQHSSSTVAGDSENSPLPLRKNNFRGHGSDPHKLKISSTPESDAEDDSFEDLQDLQVEELFVSDSLIEGDKRDKPSGSEVDRHDCNTKCNCLRQRRSVQPQVTYSTNAASRLHHAHAVNRTKGRSDSGPEHLHRLRYRLESEIQLLGVRTGVSPCCEWASSGDTAGVLAALHNLALTLEIRKQDFANMEVVGQFNLGFIIVTHEGKLFVVDQHALDEIYNYERLMRSLVLRAQPLVAPRTLELSAIDEMIILEHLTQLKKNGFIVEEDPDAAPGHRAKLVAVPVLKNVVFDDSDLHELVHKLHQHGASAERKIAHSQQYVRQTVRCTKVDTMIALRACRLSIMVGQALSKSTMTVVVQHLSTLDRPWNCPHGRPTMRHLADLEGALFGEDYQL